jgi:hypothetical protein
MLLKERRDEPFNKAEHNRNLRKLLSGPFRYTSHPRRSFRVLSIVRRRCHAPAAGGGAE